MRRRIGQRSPKDWAVVAETPEWALCLNEASKDGWTTLHLYSKVEREGKVSYWLGWSEKSKRFARLRDSVLLASYYPEVAQWVQEAMLEWAQADAAEGLV